MSELYRVAIRRVPLAALIGLSIAVGAFADDFALGTDVLNPGELHEINMTTLSTRMITDTGINDAANQPNAQAWDETNKRFYYTRAIGGEMFVWLQTDDGTPDNDHYSLGLLSAEGGPINPTLASAAYNDLNGRYYFIVDTTDDLWEVQFVPTGAAPFIAIATGGVNKIADLTSDSRGWLFGDIAITPAGLLYGSGQRSDNSEIEFFSYDLTGPGPFSSIRSAASVTGSYVLAQLSFSSGTLFGADAGNGECFTIALATGVYTSLGFASPLVRFRDMGGFTQDPGFPVTLQAFSIE